MIPFGFEPKTYCLEGSCSIQLSYGTGHKKRQSAVQFYCIRLTAFLLFRRGDRIRTATAEHLRPSGPKPDALPIFPILIMSGRQDSNLRPSGPKPDALPGCATPRNLSFYFKKEHFFERPETAWRKRDSNPRYPCEYGSLANYWFQPLTHPSFVRRSWVQI